MAHFNFKNNMKRSGVDDLTLLTRISESAIAENLKKRFMEDIIYTYIGPVLVSVNPFKQLPYFTDKEVEMYRGAASFENPPHVYALADSMYNNMMIDHESQCVIISGESGAGKTVAAKYIMGYITKVSTGTESTIQHVKECINESNPLLEAFGNAKTVRNNNSSRFGKYVEIQFNRGGSPVGGKISNFLLEKSRVVFPNPQERNFHIFYQLLQGLDDSELRDELGIIQPDYYFYLNQTGCYSVPGTDDVKEFKDTKKAMETFGIGWETQHLIWRCLMGILHLGNVDFHENCKGFAELENEQALEYPAYLWGVESSALRETLLAREMEDRWGGKGSTIQVTFTVQQAASARDALAKSLYDRIFDWLVKAINKEMESPTEEFNIGILDIYGFEIFQQNGFEQFCINFVNEKLQQIFIDLTLKQEQEEYREEGIKWTNIDYFNNKIVCDLIESRSPPGVFAVLDDVCAKIQTADNIDQKLVQNLDAAVGSHHHFNGFNQGFVIHHYAGEVSYDASGFCDKNRDILFPDFIKLMKSSETDFLSSLFPDEVRPGAGKRPTTAGTKIRTQANALVDKLKRCVPHYIRCIKPNETKRPRDWEDKRVDHQIEYLGLKENIRVRRAGFAFRRVFDKFLHRYALLTPETFPRWKGDAKSGVQHLLRAVHMEDDQYQLGRTKVFIKSPESLFLLEEQRERKYDAHARVIQKAWRKFKTRKDADKRKKEASDLLRGKKERRRHSINRGYHGDYIGLDSRPGLLHLLPRKEFPVYADVVKTFDHKFRETKIDLLLTPNALVLVGREKTKEGPEKGVLKEVVKRRHPVESISGLRLSPFQDDVVVVDVDKDFTVVVEPNFKTEFLTLLTKAHKAKTGRELPLEFVLEAQYAVKQSGFIMKLPGMRGPRIIQFKRDNAGKDAAVKVKHGKVMTVSIGPGLDKNSEPGNTFVGAPSFSANQRRPAPSPSFGGNSGLKSYRRAPAPPVGASASPNTRKRPPMPLPAEASAIQMPGSRRKLSQSGVRPAFPVSSTRRAPKKETNDEATRKFLSEVASGGKARQTRLSVGHRELAPPPEARRPPPRPAQKPEKPKPKCRAIYAYEGTDSDELSFQEGEIIDILKEDSSGWWTGRIVNRQGLFPYNYVEKL